MGLIRLHIALRGCTIPRLCPTKRSPARRFLTSSHKKNEDHDGRFELEDFNPSPPDLVKPFIFTVAFSTGSLMLAKLWEKSGKVHKQSIAQEDDLEKKKWKNTSESSVDVFFPICLMNLLVFAAWRIRGVQPIMVRYFLANPAVSNNCWPMLLSAFSHISPFHLFANMYVLNSFSPVAAYYLGTEQFFGFYFAAAVISSFASYVARVVLQRPGFSLGASGAVMAVLACATTLNPNMGLTLFPFLMLNMKAGPVLAALITADLIGLFSATSTFDHGAHLGGSAFGIFWGLIGSRLFWEKKNVYDVGRKRNK